MFAYCGNNHVNLSDHEGTFFGLAIAAGLLIKIVVAAVVAVVTTAIVVAAVKQFVAPASIPKQQDRENVKDATASSQEPTVVYCYGGTNPGNLTPKEKDKYTGLSFRTTPPPVGVPAAMTTIEGLNATGKLIAIKDGANHVSVIPSPIMGTLQNWIDEGTTHPCTLAVKSVVVKWDGGY